MSMQRAKKEEKGNGGGGYNEDGIPLLDDPVFELLTRVSLQDLAACRQVCSQWRRVSHDPAFMPLYCCHSGAISGYFVQSMARNYSSATFISMDEHRLSLVFLSRKGEVRIEATDASRRGLLCGVMDAYRKPRYFVCKPATKEWRALPNPRMRFPVVATAMVARPHGDIVFKIVHFSKLRRMDCLHCEVFDSHRWAWRRSTDVMLKPVSLCATGHQPIEAHGTLHWLRRALDDGDNDDIFAFDIKTETWKLIKLPWSVADGCSKRVVLVSMEGKLCLAAKIEEEVEMWVMVDYMMERWEKREVVSLGSLAMEHGKGVVLKDLYSSNIAVLSSFRKVLWYNFWSRKAVEMLVDHIDTQQVFKYESDLLPCDSYLGQNN